MSPEEAVQILGSFRWMADLLVEVEQSGIKFTVPAELMYEMKVTTALLEKYKNPEEILWN